MRGAPHAAVGVVGLAVDVAEGVFEHELRCGPGEAARFARVPRVELERAKLTAENAELFPRVDVEIAREQHRVAGLRAALHHGACPSTRCVFFRESRLASTVHFKYPIWFRYDTFQRARARASCGFPDQSRDRLHLDTRLETTLKHLPCLVVPLRCVCADRAELAGAHLARKQVRLGAVARTRHEVRGHDEQPPRRRGL